MRLPLVLSITVWMPRAKAAFIIRMIWGCIVGSPPENCTTSGWPSVSTKWSRMSSTSSRVRLKPGLGEAQRAVHVAGAVHFDDAETRVLLVVGAQATVVRAAVGNVSRESQGEGARLVEFSV